jgi:hypothetical protein
MVRVEKRPGLGLMPLENGLNASQPIIDLNDFACERVETCLKAREPVLEAVKSGIHIRFQTRESRVDTGKSRLDAGEPRARGVVLQYPGKDVDHHREYGQTNRKIELRIVHVYSPEYRREYPKRPHANVSYNSTFKGQQEISQ